MTIEKQIELKPCPFCGGKAVTHDCGVFEDEAINAWNRRTDNEQREAD